MKNRIVLLVVAAFFAALGDGSGAVTKTRLGALNPKSGMVVTDVDLSGVGGAGNYEVVSNRAMTAITGSELGTFAATGSVSRVHDGTNIIDAAGNVYRFFEEEITSNPKGIEYLGWELVSESLGLGAINLMYGGTNYWFYYDDPGDWRTITIVSESEREARGAEDYSNFSYPIRLYRTPAGVRYLGKLTATNDVVKVIREHSLGGIWDQELEVWWTPVMVNGGLTYQATTNVNLNAED